MTIQHSAIPDAQLHEPKGVATAASGAIYVANGAGSGTWKIPSYGELYIVGGAGVIALPAASAFTRIDTAGTIWSAGSSSDITLDITTGEITIVTTGVYSVSMWIVFTTAALAAGTRYFFRYAIDGVPIARQVSTAKQTAGIDNLDTAAMGLATLTSGQKLSLHIAGDGTSSGTNVTILEAGFTAHRV